MPLTFAYGSNMDFAQMHERCPSARFVCIAMLTDHRLAFTRRSIKRGCGVADVVPEEDRVVWGVVYEISETDLAELDCNEGYRAGRPANANAYNRRTGLVNQNGDMNKAINAEIYFAVPQENPCLPNQAYKELIVGGARSWNLPADYIAELEQIEVAP